MKPSKHFGPDEAKNEDREQDWEDGPLEESPKQGNEEDWPEEEDGTWEASSSSACMLGSCFSFLLSEG